MEIINDENLTKLIEAMVCVCQEDEDVTINKMLYNVFMS